MKTLLFFLVLTLFAFCEPKLNSQLRLNDKGEAFFVVTGNAEVKSITLWTPIDPSCVILSQSNKMIFKIPDQIPCWPAILYFVNGTEVHFTQPLILGQFWERTKKTLTPEPKGELGKL